MIRDERITGLRRRRTSTTSRSGPTRGCRSTRSSPPAARSRNSPRRECCTPECARIFQAGKTEDATACDGRPLTLHRHQREAIEVGRSRQLLRPDHRHRLRQVARLHRADRRPGAAGAAADGPDAPRRVRAIVVYPMNALANSQLEELEKYLRDGYGAGDEPVTFARYTGQENDERRRQIRDEPAGHPAHQLRDAGADAHPAGRPAAADRAWPRGCSSSSSTSCTPTAGRQGADVALLVRRVRDACRRRRRAVHRHLGHDVERRQPSTSSRTVVADVATTPLRHRRSAPEHVIGETLVRATGETAEPRAAPSGSGDRPPRAPTRTWSTDPLAPGSRRASAWHRRGTGRLVRQKPRHRSRRPPPSSPRQTGVDRRRVRGGASGARCRPGRRPRTRSPAAAVRVPAAPVPVQGRHRLRHPGGPRLTRHLTRDYQLRPAGHRTARSCCRWPSAASAARST